jgi:Dyp-type peroxidase family
MSNYKILSLDGGGIRGLLTVRLLERLTKEPGLERAFDSVDLIAGNSSGALIALAMAGARALQTPMKIALPQIREIFEGGEKVFGDPRPLWRGGYYVFAKYSGETRHEEFEKRVKEVRLRDLGTNVLITTFDLDNDGKTEELKKTLRSWKPKVFHSFRRADGSEPPNKQGKPDREQRAADVALYSSAAPSYFPTAKGYIDGGVYANNPSMCALAQVLDARYEPFPKPSVDHITMLSVGAGRTGLFIDGKKDHNWGIAPWALHHYFDLTMDAAVGIADYECRQMLGDENYRRCEVDFPAGESFTIDDVKRINRIRRIADAVKLDDYAEWLHRHWAPRPAFIAVPEPASKHVLGATELTCLIPIKPGFADVFETHSYATRIRIVLRTLNTLRQLSREVVPARVFPDVVDVIRSIHSFRLSILPGNQHLLLAVDFDRPWEPYMRIIWRDLGAILDLLLINCEGYELHTTLRGYEAFASYVRAHQVNTDLFYVGSAHTVDDVGYLTELETLVRESGDTRTFDADAAKLRVTPPEDLARRTAGAHEDEVVQQGLKALAVFHDLRELYIEGTPDAVYLRSAVLAMLKTFKPANLPIRDDQKVEYRRELEWFKSLKAKEVKTDTRKPALKEVQAGIITPYERVTYGCLLLARIEEPRKARKFLHDFASQITTHGKVNGELYINVAFTAQGLKRLGLPDAEFSALPKEFREGMESRAGLLGDVGPNHPDNWEFPEWNWDGVGRRPGANGQVSRVPLSTIDLVIQLRKREPGLEPGAAPVDDTWKGSPLRNAAHILARRAYRQGVRMLSVQPMVNHREKFDKHRGIEHFGFRDNLSQPVAGPKAGRDGVTLGEFLLGYENDRKDQPFYDRNDERVLPYRHRGSLLDNGTFLVVRKLEQHVGILYERVEQFLADNPGKGLTREQVLGKLMGREPDGRPITAPGTADNNFDYEKDNGSRCPLHAHVRRGNPRSGKEPRIARRGMSYGPRYTDPDDKERGMMFLAYNASIAEQFEVIQRWMTAGNSTGEYSGRTDPFLRVPQEGQTDIFLIPHKDGVLRMNLGKQPFVSLKWGIYLFVPSIAAIRQLAKRRVRRDPAAATAEVVIGQRVMEVLNTDEDWRAALEDSSALSSGRTAAVCAAIRKLHGGALRTPGNLVLVATEQLAMQVLRDDRTFSVSEYRNRMRQSIGDIYLGHDSTDQEYARFSREPNAAISQISGAEAFARAGAYSDSMLQTLGAVSQQRPIRLSLKKYVDRVLADLSTLWFGIPDGTKILSGGQPADLPVSPDTVGVPPAKRDAESDKVHCPYHSLAPSRYIFSSPRPRKLVELVGQRHGEAFRRRVEELAREKYPREWPLQLPLISQAVWNTCLKNDEPQFHLFSRMLVGVMEGFLPTVYGNFLKIMYTWLTDQTLWRVQQDLLLLRPPVCPTVPAQIRAEYRRAQVAVMPSLLRAMQARPVPDMVYRTATQRACLGGVDVEAGDRVVVLIGSVTQELAAKGCGRDVHPVFGRNRDTRPQPTHACPGYEMGLGVVLGLTTTLLEAGPLAPTSSPFIVNLLERRGSPRPAQRVAVV